jgi:hypothetical protein
MNSQDWQDRLLNAAVLAALFFVVSHPTTYKLVDHLLAPLFGRLFRAYEGGCPTSGGVMMHTLVFFGIIVGLSYAAN